MKRQLYSSKAVVLSRRYFSEADAIVVLYTEKYGKLSVVAKGVKRLASRKKGFLEPFSLVNFSGGKSHGMPVISEVSAIESFASLRKDLKKVAVAYYFLELANKSSFEEEKNLEIYELLVNYLYNLENSENLKALRLDFARSLLTILGFWPRGKPMKDPDINVEQVIEKSLYSIRVGRALVA